MVSCGVCYMAFAFWPFAVASFSRGSGGSDIPQVTQGANWACSWLTHGRYNRGGPCERRSYLSSPIERPERKIIQQRNNYPKPSKLPNLSTGKGNLFILFFL